MVLRLLQQSTRQLAVAAFSTRSSICRRCVHNIQLQSSATSHLKTKSQIQVSWFHASTYRSAQSPTADAVVENLTELYATAKDEFEIAAEETEKKTIYAQDDRDAAREALTKLKEMFERSQRENDPEVAREVKKRVEHRIRELEHAVIAMEESALEE